LTETNHRSISGVKAFGLLQSDVLVVVVPVGIQDRRFRIGNDSWIPLRLLTPNNDQNGGILTRGRFDDEIIVIQDGRVRVSIIDPRRFDLPSHLSSYYVAMQPA
jgi:hypothetical protein